MSTVTFEELFPPEPPPEPEPQSVTAICDAIMRLHFTADEIEAFKRYALTPSQIDRYRVLRDNMRRPR